MHQMAVLAQYKDDMSNVYCENLDSDFYGDEMVITDIIFYVINDVLIQDIPHYIAFGWGTFGGGSHFKIVKVFKIDKSEISNDNKIFKTNDDLHSELYLSTSRGTKTSGNSTTYGTRSASDECDLRQNTGTGRRHGIGVHTRSVQI